MNIKILNCFAEIRAKLLLAGLSEKDSLNIAENIFEFILLESGLIKEEYKNEYLNHINGEKQ